MGMQFLLRAPNVEAVAQSLGEVGGRSEIFEVSSELIGLSVPTNIVDSLGEEHVMAAVSEFNAYELWSGKWRQPSAPAATKPRWKFW